MTASMGRLGSTHRRGHLWSLAVVLVLTSVRSLRRSSLYSSRTEAVADSFALARRKEDTPPVTWNGLLFALYDNIGKHRVVALAAGVTFYSILALFPAIAALVSLYGLFADPAAIATHLESVSGVLPGGAIQVVGDELNRLVSQGGGKLGATFLIGLAAALWSANAGMKSLMDALNLVYGVPEQRGVVKFNAISLAFTAGMIGFVLLALAGMVVLPLILEYTGVNFHQILKVARWPALLVVAGFGLALLYRFGPSSHEARWKWISWGSAFAAVAWLIVSFLFTWYAANFGNYNKTYGSLGAIIGFMVWIWISTIVILLGAEIDAHLEKGTGNRAK